MPVRRITSRPTFIAPERRMDPTQSQVERRRSRRKVSMTQTESTYQVLGKGRKAIDGMEKVTGRARYVADINLPGMLYARSVLSPYAHAKIVSIDASKAKEMPGIVAVLTAQDLPTRDRAINSRHSAVLAKDKVFFRGQPVVVVVGESESAAQD